MALIRHNPWGELFALTDTMDELVRRTVMPRQETAFLPLDIRQTDEAYTIEASLPGFRPADVDVTLDENVLTIKAQHTASDEADAKGGYVRRERRMSSVYRQIGLPAEVTAEGITATFDNGVLVVTVPRAQKAQPRRIAVTAQGASEATTVETTAVEAPSQG